MHFARSWGLLVKNDDCKEFLISLTWYSPVIAKKADIFYAYLYKIWSHWVDTSKTRLRRSASSASGESNNKSWRRCKSSFSQVTRLHPWKSGAFIGNFSFIDSSQLYLFHWQSNCKLSVILSKKSPKIFLLKLLLIDCYQKLCGIIASLFKLKIVNKNKYEKI